LLSFASLHQKPKNTKKIEILFCFFRSF